MIAFTLAVLSLYPESLEALERHAASIREAVPILQGRYSGTWGITGRQVKAALGEPSQIQTITCQSARTYNYCWCDYERIGVRIIVYAENQLVWATPECIGSARTGRMPSRG